jgi:hypothetical protein
MYYVVAGGPPGSGTYRWKTFGPSMISNGKDSVVKTARLLNRREFSGFCGALGSFVASSRALALDAATAVTSTGTAQTVRE